MKDPDLAAAAVALLADLEDRGAIERCAHRGCRRLAVGLPDFGPSVEAAVCENHVPEHATLIDSLSDVAETLRAMYEQLARYGYVYDPETGDRVKEKKANAPPPAWAQGKASGTCPHCETGHMEQRASPTIGAYMVCVNGCGRSAEVKQ